jgi:DNA photolyase
MAANGAADTGSGGRAVLWFRNDLRTHDNAIIAEAARRAKAGQINEVRSYHGMKGHSPAGCSF